MTCAQVKSMLSAYLDGSVSGRQMHDLSGHLQTCGLCGAEYEALRRTQTLVSAIGRTKAPADLSLKLRLALSRASASVSAPDNYSTNQAAPPCSDPWSTQQLL